MVPVTGREQPWVAQSLALETWVFFALVARSILLMRMVNAFMIAMTVAFGGNEVTGRPLACAISNLCRCSATPTPVGCQVEAGSAGSSALGQPRANSGAIPGDTRLCSGAISPPPLLLHTSPSGGRVDPGEHCRSTCQAGFPGSARRAPRGRRRGAGDATMCGVSFSGDRTGPERSKVWMCCL